MAPSRKNESPPKPTAARKSQDPSRADIARRAYEIWRQRGGGEDGHLQDWLRAERELTGKS
jgi:hypothetical protein